MHAGRQFQFGQPRLEGRQYLAIGVAFGCLCEHGRHALHVPLPDDGGFPFQAGACDLAERYESMSGQYKDLVQAKESLERIIQKINSDSRRLFMETLEAM